MSESTRIRLGLFLDDPDLLGQVEEVLGGTFEVVARAAPSGPFPGELDADVALLDLGPDSEVPRLEALQRAHPRLPVVVLSRDDGVEHLRRALAAGARDFLLLPLESRSVNRTLRRVGRRGQARREILGGAGAGPGNLPGAGTWFLLAAGAGVGRTTFGLGLANELALLGGRVGLVDADLAADDVAFYLGLPRGRPDLPGALAAFEEDPHFLRDIPLDDLLVPHPAGFGVLKGPEDLLLARELDPGALPNLIEGLAARLDQVLAELPPGIPGWLHPGNHPGARYLVVGGAAEGPRKNLLALVDGLRKLGVAPAALRAVVAAPPDATETPDRIRRDLEARGLASPALLPFDPRAADAAVRAGQPVSRLLPESRLGDSIRRVAARFLREEIS